MSTGIVSGFVEFELHTALEGLPDGHPRRRFQLVLLRLLDETSNLLFLFGYLCIDEGHGRFICNCIPDTDAETIVEKPVIDDALKTREERPRCFRSFLAKHNMHEATL